jgi:hypothetical protein
MKKTYKVTVLIGTVYEAEIEAENLEQALAEAHEGDGSGWDDSGIARTVIVEHEHGVTADGFGVETAWFDVTVTVPGGFVGK